MCFPELNTMSYWLQELISSISVVPRLADLRKQAAAAEQAAANGAIPNGKPLPNGLAPNGLPNGTGSHTDGTSTSRSTASTTVGTDVESVKSAVVTVPEEPKKPSFYELIAKDEGKIATNPNIKY